MTDPATFIRTHLPIIEVPALPEIRLHRAQPSSGLRRLALDGQSAGSPYWAYFWPGGLALARYLRDHPASVAGRRVLDLGSGSGLVGIAAAKAGARAVIASETDANACIAIRLNAAANGVDLTIVGDYTAVDPPPVDIVLVGDLFYNRALAKRVTAFLNRCLSKGIEVLVGDPGRAYLPFSRLRRIDDFDVMEVGGSPDGPPVRSSVFVFETKCPKSLEVAGRLSEPRTT